MAEEFRIEEATVGSIHDAFKSGELTARQLVQGYLDRISAYDQNGPAINSIITIDPTALCYVPSISVPAAGFSSDGIPAGITFLGRPYSDGQMLKYAYAYEQATKHRRPPESAPPLKG